MSEINLNEYLEQIDTMLEDRYFDEAIFHCRHILQQLPKNIAAYRRLGRALLSQDKWQEAGEVLRRVLSVAPDEKFAHLGLSQVYRKTKQYNQAIWHLERAWEHTPNNPTLSEELKDLYFTHRKVENARLQLTAGAVARQYIQNEVYDQAISILANTLRNARDRVDLRLLLARTQREDDRRMDAAETAMNIIGVLPDCLEANFILADLWLQEKRPSDAQRYLSRIEAVDPYIAIKLAQGQSAPDEAVMLDFGDYQTSAAKELNEVEPDWLTTLGGSSNEEIDDAVAEALSQTDEDDDDFDTLFMDEVPDIDDDLPDFLSDADDQDDFDLDSLFSDDDLGSTSDAIGTVEESSAPPPRQSTGLTGMLASLGDDDDDFDLDAMLQDDSNTGDLNALLQDDDDDDFDSLFTDDMSDDGEPDFDALLQGDDDPDDLLQDDSTTDEELDALFDNVEAVASDEPLPDWMAEHSSDADDPLAWMKESGIEVINDDEAQGRFNPAAYEEDDNVNFSDPEEVDPLAWLKESGVELIEDDEDVSAPQAASESDDDESVDPMEIDPLAWMKESGVELIDDEEIPTAAAIQVPEEDELELTDDSLLDEMMAMEELTATGPLAASEENTMTDQPPDWLDDNEDDDTPDWLADDGGDDAFAWEDSAGDTSNWEIEDPSEDEADDDDDTPDWLVGAVEDGDAADDDDFDFAAELEADDDDTPDWLAGAVEDGDAADDQDFDLAAELETDDDDDDDTPEWLAGIAGDSDTDDDFDFATKLEADSEENFDFAAELEDDDAIQDETPDWLEDVSHDGETNEEASSDFDRFVADLEETEEEEAPEWLNDMSDTMAATTAETIDDVPDWMAGDEDEEEELEPSAALDWLSDEDEDTDDNDPFSFGGDAPSWLDDVSEDDTDNIDTEAPGFEVEEEETVEDLPDWLAADDMEDDEEPLPWMAEEADEVAVIAAAVPDEDRSPAPADNAPDWLNAMVPGFDVDYEAEEDAPIERTFLPAQQAAAARDGADVAFNWLNAIVEAEMYQPPEVALDMLPGTEKPAEQPRQPRTVPRFVFSKPPLWKRKQQADPVAEDDEIGEALPDWLTEGDDDLLDDDDLLSSDLFDDEETDVLDNSFFDVEDDEEDDFLFADDNKK